MIVKLLVIGIGGFLVLFGFSEFSTVYRNSEPARVACSRFVADQDRPKWVSVDDCVMYLGKFEYVHSKGSDTNDKASVLLFPSRKDAENNAARTSVVIEIDDRVMMADAARKIEDINKASKRVDEILARLKTNQVPDAERAALVSEGQKLEENLLKVQDALYVQKPMVFKSSALRPDFNLLKTSLAEGYGVYDISSADDKPSYAMGLLALLGGVALVFVALFVSFGKEPPASPAGHQGAGRAPAA